MTGRGRPVEHVTAPRGRRGRRQRVGPPARRLRPRSCSRRAAGRLEQHFESKGYAPVAVDWPGDQRFAAAHANKDSLAGTSVADVADHVAEVIAGLDRKPIVIGHSFGGLLVQMVAGRGLAAAAVAIDPAPSRGVLPLPFSALKASFPVLGNPLNRGRTYARTGSARHRLHARHPRRILSRVRYGHLR